MKAGAASILGSVVLPRGGEGLAGSCGQPCAAATGVEMVVNVLERRGISVGPAVRARVNAGGDPDDLTIWVIRALHVKDAAEIFLDA